MRISAHSFLLRVSGAAVTLALLAALPLAAATGAAGARSVSRLRILAPSSTAALPFLLMAKEDPIEGIDIQAEIVINHAQALALLLRGEADLLCTGTSQGWENRMDGSPIQMIGTGI